MIFQATKSPSTSSCSIDNTLTSLRCVSSDLQIFNVTIIKGVMSSKLTKFVILLKLIFCIFGNS